MVGDPAKLERIDMRLSSDHKEIIERAATAVGQTLTTFAVSTLVERAHEVLAREEETRLSARDRTVFLKIMDESEPNQKLKRAARRYKGRYG